MIRSIFIENLLKFVRCSISCDPAPAPAIPAATGKMSLLSATGLDAAACARADKAMIDDPWDLTHLGDHGLCRFASGDQPTATTAAEQLESFSPNDWRTSLLRGELHFQAQEISEGIIAYHTAIALCDDSATRARLQARLSQISG